MGNNKEKGIAKLVMMNFVVEYNDTTLGGAWISSLDGDLTIQNLRLVDAGVYKCRFTGSSDKLINLVVTGESILYWYMVFWLADWYLMNWEIEIADIYHYNVLWQMDIIFVVHIHHWLQNHPNMKYIALWCRYLEHFVN